MTLATYHLALVLIALFAGVGITALGPGGVFVTVALFLLAPLSAAEVAGTASASFVFTGLFGVVAYWRSGEYSRQRVPEMTFLVSFAGLLGALLGSRINLYFPEIVFSAGLALFLFCLGVIILFQQLCGKLETYNFNPPPGQFRLTLFMLGLFVGVIGGLLGVGGPIIAVPLLVLLRVPLLIALAVAQVQSVFIAFFAAAGYFQAGAVVWPLVVLVTPPLLVGALLGWWLAHYLDSRPLRLTLGVVLLLVAPSVLL